MFFFFVFFFFIFLSLSLLPSSAHKKTSLFLSPPRNTTGPTSAPITETETFRRPAPSSRSSAGSFRSW